MMDAREPFENVVVALVSHAHLDHFQKDTAIEFLQKNPECALIASEEVAVAIRDSASKPSVANEAVVVWPEPGKVKNIEQAGFESKHFACSTQGHAITKFRILDCSCI